MELIWSNNFLQGLENAVSYLLPHAEHRNCARHIFANWRKKGHSTEALRALFWKAVKCTTHEDFTRIMRQMSTLKPQATQDFQAVRLTKFCRAYISERPKCEVINNNICECFNNYILRATSRPIIDMLEDIRTAIMQRIIEKRELFSDRSDEVCPRARLLLEANKVESKRCNVAHSGDYKFEVTLSGNRFVVDLNARACTCRYFDVRGIPCSHAVACILWARQDPANFVSDYFKKDVYKRAYIRGIPPMNGRNLWTQVEVGNVFPPLVRRQPGRPKQKRRVDSGERHLTSPSLSRKGMQMTCSMCHQVGHNKKTCTQRRMEDGGEVWFDLFPNFLSML